MEAAAAGPAPSAWIETTASASACSPARPRSSTHGPTPVSSVRVSTTRTPRAVSRCADPPGDVEGEGVLGVAGVGRGAGGVARLGAAAPVRDLAVDRARGAGVASVVAGVEDDDAFAGGADDADVAVGPAPCGSAAPRRAARRRATWLPPSAGRARPQDGTPPGRRTERRHSGRARGRACHGSLCHLWISASVRAALIHRTGVRLAASRPRRRRSAITRGDRRCNRVSPTGNDHAAGAEDAGAAHRRTGGARLGGGDRPGRQRARAGDDDGGGRGARRPSTRRSSTRTTSRPCRTWSSARCTTPRGPRSSCRRRRWGRWPAGWVTPAGSACPASRITCSRARSRT